MVNQPASIPNSLEEFSMLSYTQILNPIAQDHIHLNNFMKHLRSLKKAGICIDTGYNSDDDEAIGHTPTGITVGRFDALATTLTFSRNTLEEVYFRVRSSKGFLQFCLPVQGLQEFRVLKKLEIPYDGLLGFGAITHQPTISDILPPNLESLTILYPMFEIYTWLEPLTRNKSILPKLVDIHFDCHNDHNDDYATFAFLNWPNKVEDDLKRIRGIDVDLSYPENDWLDEWYEYELGSNLLEEWQIYLSNGGNFNDPTISIGEKDQSQSQITLGNKESWLSRYRSCLGDWSWKIVLPVVDPVPEHRWIWVFQKGRWGRRKVIVNGDQGN